MALFEPLIVDTEPTKLGWTPINDGVGMISAFGSNRSAQEWNDWTYNPILDTFTAKSRAIAGGGVYLPYKSGDVTAGYTMSRDGDDLSTPTTSVLGRMVKVDGYESALSYAIREFDDANLFTFFNLWMGGVPIQITDKNVQKVARVLVDTQFQDPYAPVVALAVMSARTKKSWGSFTEQERRVWKAMAEQLTRARMQLHAFMLQHEEAMGQLAAHGDGAKARGKLAGLLGVPAVGGSMQHWNKNGSKMEFGGAY